MKNTKEKYIQFAKTALIYVLISPIVFWIFDYFSNNVTAWYLYLFQGVVFGILMAAFMKFLGEKK